MLLPMLSNVLMFRVLSPSAKVERLKQAGNALREARGVCNGGRGAGAVGWVWVRTGSLGLSYLLRGVRKVLSVNGFVFCAWVVVAVWCGLGGLKRGGEGGIWRAGRGATSRSHQ